MGDFIMANEPAIRLSVFLGIFAVVAIGETLAPRRQRSLSRLARWPHNIGVVVVNTLIVRLAFPTAAVGLALLGEAGPEAVVPLSRGAGLGTNITINITHPLGTPEQIRRAVLDALRGLEQRNQIAGGPGV